MLTTNVDGQTLVFDVVTQKTTDITKALSIEGWMEPDELVWLAHQASKHSVIAEVGSYLGRSTRALADNTSGIVYAIDDFYGPRELEERLKNRETIFDRFTANMAGLEGRLAVIRANHRELPPLDFSPDFVFLDGSHEYADVVADINCWLPRIRRGTLAGHDFKFSEDVTRAVKELIPDFRIGAGSIWFKEIL